MRRPKSRQLVTAVGIVTVVRRIVFAFGLDGLVRTRSGQGAEDFAQGVAGDAAQFVDHGLADTVLEGAERVGQAGEMVGQQSYGTHVSSPGPGGGPAANGPPA